MGVGGTRDGGWDERREGAVGGGFRRRRGGGRGLARARAGVAPRARACGRPRAGAGALPPPLPPGNGGGKRRVVGGGEVEWPADRTAEPGLPPWQPPWPDLFLPPAR